MWGEHYARRSRKSDDCRRSLERRFSALSKLAQERDRRRKKWEAEYKANASKIQRERDENRKEIWMGIKEALKEETK